MTSTLFPRFNNVSLFGNKRLNLKRFLLKFGRQLNEERLSLYVIIEFWIKIEKCLKKILRRHLELLSLFLCGINVVEVILEKKKKCRCYYIECDKKQYHHYLLTVLQMVIFSRRTCYLSWDKGNIRTRRKKKGNPQKPLRLEVSAFQGPLWKI